MEGTSKVALMFLLEKRRGTISSLRRLDNITLDEEPTSEEAVDPNR